MQFCTPTRSCSVRRHWRPSRDRSSQISSELPPPMSNTSAQSQLRSSNDAQPDTASFASVSRPTISSLSPVSFCTRSMNSALLVAMRQASVAISRDRVTPRRRILSAHTRSASTVRLMASLESRPEPRKPSPRRMMRENASMTRKPRRDGLAIRRRQLLVPRSSAPYTEWAGACASAPGPLTSSAAPARPSAGAPTRGCAPAWAKAPPPLSPASLRMAFASRGSTAAGRTLPLGPVTLFNLSRRKPPRVFADGATALILWG